MWGRPLEKHIKVALGLPGVEIVYQEELRTWRRMIADLPDLPELQALAGMLNLWQEEILNYFTFRVTQGPVEGQNHRAKVIQRRAYDYRSFTNYRRRLLLAGYAVP